ncbi:hypothetical protein [Caballeronia sp. LjRoot31]|uniref:hypothetical protein n=1 Tax=Caballeronia sp. LjRoot31 TaxID=3342324 RepID=UPI003F4FFB3E
MGAVVGRHGKAGISDRADRALGSAAGALSHADGADAVFDMPDAEVGRLTKQKARVLKRAVEALRAKDRGGHPLTEPVSIELPVESGEREHPEPRKEDFEVRGRAYHQSLVSSKKLLSSGDMQEALAITCQALSAAIKASRMFTVQVEGQTYYPGFFADGEVDRSVLEKISRALGNVPGWIKWDFFTARRGSLGDISALAALRKGKVQDVERVAQALAEEIASEPEAAERRTRSDIVKGRRTTRR